MPSATRSSEERRGWFSMALFRKNTARFWPLWVGYGVLQFFVLDMYLIQGWGFWRMDSAGRSETMREWVMGCTESAATMGAFFGVLFTMALFSYLMNSKAVGFMHSLPIRREGLFLTNFVQGFCFFLVPDLTVAVIAVLAGVFWGVNLVGVTAAWLVGQVLVGMLFFSFAVCCAMFTGHILALPVFYGILNVLVAGLSVLVDVTLDVLLVGYNGNGFISSAFTKWCTPVWHLTNQLSPQRIYDDVGRATSNYMTIPGLAAGLAYAFVLCAVFTSIALWVYHARELERAGDVVTVGWVRPVFQYGLGFCVGLAGGVAVYQMFFSYKGQDWAFIILVALWAVVGAFAGRMFLKKTLRVFADGWKGPVVFGVCMILLLAGVRMDLTGYQRWVPDADKVQSVSIGGINSAPWDRANYGYPTLTDPGDIAAFVEFHRALVADLDVLRGDGDDYYRLDEGGYETAEERYINVAYTMEDGSTVRRYWDDVPITAEALNDPNTYAAKLQAILNRPSVVKELYQAGFMEDPEMTVEVVGGYLNNIRSGFYDLDAELVEQPAGAAEGPTVGAADIELTTQKRREDQLDLSAEQAKILWVAVQEDMEAGNIRRYLLDSKERYENCYQTDLCIQFLYTFINRDGERESSTWTLEITLQKSATETLNVLDGMGYKMMLAPWNNIRDGGKG